MNDDERPMTITEFVAYAHGGAFVRDLPPHVRDVLMACEPFSSDAAAVQFTDQHRAILRRARFLLDPAENTAPALDPMRPFGTPNALGDVGLATGIQSWEGAAQLYCEVQGAIPLLFQHGTLPPGQYPISNLSMRELTWITDDQAKTLDIRLQDIGIGPSRLFNFTEQHQALLRSVCWRWEDWTPEVADESKVWPVAFVDAKRTYSLNALRDNFGWKPNPNRHGFHQMTDEQSALVWETHKELHPAFQVFVEHAELAAGTYPATYEL